MDLPCLHRKGIQVTLGIFLALVLSFSTGWAASPSVSGGPDPHGPASVETAGTVTPWNPNVFCEGNEVTVSYILGSAYPAQSLASSPYQRDNTSGGVPHPRALSPPCTMTNASGGVMGTFVQINGVYLADLIYQWYDCSNHYAGVNGGGPYPNNETICEWQGTLFEMGTTEGWLQIEFEKDWLAKGNCGPGVPSCDNAALLQYVSNGTVSLDVQGFVFWDGENWELHPFTGWRLSAPPPPPPDFWMEASPTSLRIALGHSDTSTLMLWSLNGYEGTVSLTVSIDAVDVPPLLPTIFPDAWADPTSLTLAAGGKGSSTLTVSASLLTTPGMYAVTVTATDGSITRSVTIAVEIVLF
jgi:hypothetical protein